MSEYAMQFIPFDAGELFSSLSDSAMALVIFRHHRHHGLSIRLITQTVDEFFERPGAEMILDQCAIKQFHRLDGRGTTGRRSLA